MWINALRTTEDAVNTPLAPMNTAASIAPVILDTPVMVSPAQVSQLFMNIKCLSSNIKLCNMIYSTLIHNFAYDNMLKLYLGRNV